MISVTKIVLIALIFGISDGLHHNDYQQQLYQNTYDVGQKIFSESEAPNTFPTTASPLTNPNKSPEYRNFLKELYRFDRDKSPTTFQVISSQPPTASILQIQQQSHPVQQIQYVPYQAAASSPVPQLLHHQPYIQHQLVKRAATKTEATNDRGKRAIIFRPLFVYRQQEIKKQNQKASKAENRRKYMEHFRY